MRLLGSDRATGDPARNPFDRTTTTGGRHYPFRPEESFFSTANPAGPAIAGAGLAAARE